MGVFNHNLNSGYFDFFFKIGILKYDWVAGYMNAASTQR